MTNSIYDNTRLLLAAGPGLQLHLTEIGTTFIDSNVESTDDTAILADKKHSILVAAGASVTGALTGIELKGADSVVHNEGTIGAATGTGILFSGGGLNRVTNLGQIDARKGIVLTSSATARLELYNTGTVSATDKAVTGGANADVIFNTKEIKTTGEIAIDLGGGSDFYDGTRGTVIGRILLGTGNDTAYGGAGNEIFYGGAGADYIDAGDGIDTADYSDATENVSVNLNSDSEQYVGTDQGWDTLLNFEIAIGGDHNDTLIGNGLQNTLTGGEGNDILDGGAGNDSLDGGAGNDTARYSGSAAVTVDLSIAVAQDTKGHGWDTLVDIENLEGGSGADTLIGNGGDNKLSGSAGSDTLKGGGGNDTLDGGSGRNTAEFSGSRSQYTISAVDADGWYTVTHNGGGADGVDKLKDVRFLKFSDQTIAATNKAPSNITLSKSSLSESTAAGSAVMTITGSDGDDDALTFTAVDMAGGLFSISDNKLILNRALDYETATSHSVTIRAQDAYGGVFDKTFTINVQNVVESLPLRRVGTAAGNSLAGENGNDTLFGMGGNDTLYGGAGDDKLYGGAGKDILLGEEGRDIFVFDQKPNVKTNLDTIYDFNPREDTIHLARSAFNKISKGTLKKSAFVLGERFTDKDDRILYSKKIGAIFYDPDGNGPAKAVQIASASKNLAITHKDFFIF
jgi:Ca2+-binding RTX toxin-like protein